MEIISTLVLGAALAVPPAAATPVTPPITPRLIITVPTSPAPTAWAQRPIVPVRRARRHPGVRAAIIAAAAFGGLYAGAHIGARLEPNCRCDDPGLKGALIGMPIGAVAAGIAAAVLTR